MIYKSEFLLLLSLILHVLSDDGENVLQNFFVHNFLCTALSGKPVNVREFDTCQGNVRDFTKNQGNVREKLPKTV